MYALGNGIHSYCVALLVMACPAHHHLLCSNRRIPACKEMEWGTIWVVYENVHNDRHWKQCMGLFAMNHKEGRYAHTKNHLLFICLESTKHFKTAITI